ncbi:microtubule-associated protein tau isoform X3 [Anoplophora glabripennis]|uniref:microtubule-associated protein tau isoform X3 n=1 Tax=Anoplophora glabripennis TaxID=217634 RepID=UPI00087393BA|nr:microtubule-associated protein tau isoform X3 [Anoplophora glabripennis]
MSQQPNSVVNGPYTEYNAPMKDEIINKDMPTVQQNGSNSQPQQPPQFPHQPPQPAGPVNPLRPLTRIDSRSSFQFRPPFPNQQGAPVRPGQVRQPTPPGTQQYIQRNPVPGPGQRPPIAPAPPAQAFPQAQNRDNYRPVTPFPRAPVQPQRPLFQQRSVPAFATQKPQLQEENLSRSQTLDTTEIDHSKSADEKNTSNDHIKAPSIAAMNNRSYSLSSNPPEQSNEAKEEARRRSVSSVDSLGEGRPGSRHSSISGSAENLDKKQDNEVPSRPESRAMSRMNKIIEDESPSSLTDVSQKSPDLSERSRPASKTPENNFSNKPTSPSPKPQTPVPKSPSPVPQSPSFKFQPQSPGLQNQNQTYSPQSQSPKPPLSPGPPRTPRDRNVSPQPPSPHSPNQNANKVVDEKGAKGAAGRPERLLHLEKPAKSKSPSKSEGDNDSGVDESTQGNDPSSNGENRSPRKSNKSRTSSTTPTARSLSRGSKSPSLKSPDSNATTPGSATEKKIPMNKVQVGSAPSPNLKVVKSKIGSLDNASYKPGGGKVKIESKKLDFKAAGPRIEAKNDRYMPKGGEKKIVHQKLHWNAKSKVGSLENATYKPKGGDKKIESVKLDFKGKAKPKVGSKDNIKHQPGGGDIKSEAVMEEKDTGNEKKSTKNDKDIETKKIDLNVTSKIGSLDNMKHRPGGGDKKIFDDKDYLKQKSGISSVDHSLSGSQNSLPSQPDANKVPVADENLNQEH